MPSGEARFHDTQTICLTAIWSGAIDLITKKDTSDKPLPRVRIVLHLTTEVELPMHKPSSNPLSLLQEKHKIAEQVEKLVKTPIVLKAMFTLRIQGWVSELIVLFEPATRLIVAHPKTARMLPVLSFIIGIVLQSISFRSQKT